MKYSTLFLLLLALIICFYLSDCNGDKEDQAKDLTWEDVKDWEGISVSSGIYDHVIIKHNEDETDQKWALVFVDLDHDPQEDTTIFGPFSGHYPFDYDIEYFENDEKNHEDDEWVIEYACPEGCCVQVYGKDGGKIKLRKTYSISNRNCQFTQVDTTAGTKKLYFTNFTGDSVSVFAINFHTGDSLFFASDSGNIQTFRDLEALGGKIITVRHVNDTNYVTIKAIDGSVEEQFKMPGRFVKIRDDQQSTKILVTKSGDFTKSRVIIVSTTPVSAGPDIIQRGELVDLQMHKVNNQTYYLVTSHDPVADVTHISIIGQNGQGIGNHSLPGKFFRAKKRPNDNKKVFVTSQPASNDGSGSAKIGVYDIVSGNASTSSPTGISGKPTGLGIDSNGNVTVDTQDASGTASSTNVLIN